jgi:hypothetical protein
LKGQDAKSTRTKNVSNSLSTKWLRIRQQTGEQIVIKQASKMSAGCALKQHVLSSLKHHNTFTPFLNVQFM